MKCSLLTLSCYVDDELESRRRGEMEAHLVGCARCRAGLAHIREEVDRVGALARVRVVDESAHALMVQLGLLESDDPLPERSAPTDDDRTAGLPPWLQGQATASLPWTPERPRREASPPPRPEQGDLGLGGVPAAHRRLSALEGVPAVPFDVAMLTADAVVPMTPRGAQRPSGPAGRTAPPPPPVEAAPPPVATPPPPAVSPPPPAVTPPPPLEEPAAAEVPADVAPDPAAEGAAPEASAPPAQRPWPVAPVAVGDLYGIWAEEPPLDLRPARPPSAPTVEALEEIPRGAPDHDTEATPPPDSAGDDDAAHAAPPSRGDTAVAVWTTDPSVAPPPGADYPIEDEDVLEEPLPVERFTGGPVRAPRPTLVDRLRDRLALRGAMASPVDDTDSDAEVEIVSGAGAPLHARGRTDLARRRAEALRPAAGQDAPVDERHRREPGIREMLPPPARPSATDPLLPELGHALDPVAEARDFPPSSVDLRELGGQPRARAGGFDEPRTRAGGLEQPRAGAGGVEIDRVGARGGAAVAERPVRRREPEAQPRVERERPARRAQPTPADRAGRRTAIAYGMAAAVVAAVGIASARVTSPLPVPPVASSSTQDIPVAPPANSAATGSSSSSAPSAGQSTAPAAAAPAAAAPSAPSSAGSGGTGWAVQGIRVGDHGTYYRFVFDLGAAVPGATGEPKVVLTYPDATTLVVTITGASAAAAAPSIGKSAVVSGIASEPSATPGTAVYRITLAKPATGKPIYLSGPLRLVVDVTAS